MKVSRNRVRTRWMTSPPLDFSQKSLHSWVLRFLELKLRLPLRKEQVLGVQRKLPKEKNLHTPLILSVSTKTACLMADSGRFITLRAAVRPRSNSGTYSLHFYILLKTNEYRSAIVEASTNLG